ncbi:MAG: hypothetical protein ACR2JB_05420 [Bryobacteraceae bacterium]
MFKANGRLVLAAAFGSTCVSILLGFQTDRGAQDSASRKQHVQVRIFNLARVPRRDLSRAEGEVTRIFGEAEMEVNWAEGSLEDTASLITDFSANNSSPTGCNAARHAGELRLQLLPYAPHGVDARTLGFSLPCAAFGIDSTIFIDNCESVTCQTLASFSKVLAYAMAHELGHVLLRSAEHAQTGLMSARWDKAAWLRATVRGIPIDKEQGRLMRIELSTMSHPPAKEKLQWYALKRWRAWGERAD